MRKTAEMKRVETLSQERQRRELMARSGPYITLQRALVAANAQRLAVIAGPNTGDHPGASELEF